ncbi:MAG: response regulator transcription factor [Balneolaceae bacterium]|nr:response regulator transcription factor [Balneolaceae bacterium]
MEYSFVYIGQRNQTNTIISETLIDEFGCAVHFHNVDEILKNDTIFEKLQPHLIIIDLYTSPGSAPSQIRKIRAIAPASPILALHVFTEAKLKTPLLDSGANEVLSTTPSQTDLIDTTYSLIKKSGSSTGTRD